MLFMYLSSKILLIVHAVLVFCLLTTAISFALKAKGNCSHKLHFIPIWYSRVSMEGMLITCLDLSDTYNLHCLQFLISNFYNFLENPPHPSLIRTMK